MKWNQSPTAAVFAQKRDGDAEHPCSGMFVDENLSAFHETHPFVRQALLASCRLGVGPTELLRRLSARFVADLSG
jgi:hypothetical protein